MEQLKTFFAGKTVNSILDVGTGLGDFIKLISSYFSPETHITGIDPSEEAVAGARQQNDLPNVEFLRMEGEKMNFPDQSFDLVCLSNAMHHLASTDQTFAEMKRVVKPGGWLLIAEIVADNLNEAQETQKMVHHFKSYVDRKMGITHRETWPRTEILEIIRSAGINPVLTFDFNRMKEATHGAGEHQKWIHMFSSHLAQLEGYAEFQEMEALFEQFKERLNRHGFQFAPQLVVLGQKE